MHVSEHECVESERAYMGIGATCSYFLWVFLNALNLSLLSKMQSFLWDLLIAEKPEDH